MTKWLAVLCYLLSSSIIGQSVQLIELDKTLDSLKEESCFEQYYSHTFEEVKASINLNRCSLLLKYLDLYNYLPINSEEKKLYRYHTSHYAYRLMKCGFIKESQQIYLRGHQYVEDKKYFDKHLWYLEKIIGSNYAKLGDHEKAIYFYKLCIPGLKSQQNYSNLSRLYSDLGNVYLWQGDTLEAKKSYDLGLAMAYKYNSVKGLMTNHLSLAELDLHQGNENGFLHGYDQVMKFLSKQKGDKYYHKRMGEIEQSKGDYFKSNGNYSEAIVYFQTAINHLKLFFPAGKSREISKVYHKLSQCYLLQNNFNAVYEIVDTALSYLIIEYKSTSELEDHDLFNENTIMDLLLTKAKSLNADYQYTNVISKLMSSIELIDFALTTQDKLHSDLTMSSSKLISVQTNKKLIEVGLATLFELHKRLPDKYKKKIDEYFIRSKNIVLNEERNKIDQISRLPLKDQQLIENLEGDIIGIIQQKKQNDNDSLDALYLLKRDSIKSMVGEVEVQVNNDWNKPFVDYTLVDKVYIYTNLSKEAFYCLGNTDSIRNLVTEILGDIDSRNDEEALKFKLVELTKKLLPIEVGNISILNIIPDDILCAFPFDILRQDSQYLIEKVAINYHFARNESTNKSRNIKANNKLLCVVPKYEMSKINKLDSDEERSGIYHLAYADAEFKGIEKVWDNIEMQKNFNLGDEADIFHYAGHAIVDGDDSYLQIGSRPDEKITYEEIQNTKVNYLMVCLSACETGLGKLRIGEGLKSLANAFLSSGTQSLVYTLWRVNDMSTSELMVEFYSNLKSSRLPIALQKSKLSYLANVSPIKRHPYYWASFCLISNESEIENEHLLFKSILFALIIFFTINLFIKKYNF